MASDALREQVVVATFPNKVIQPGAVEGKPEVYIVTHDAAKRVVNFKEASIRDAGSVSFGREVSIALADAGSVELDDGIIAIVGRKGEVLVQLHMDPPSDKAWFEMLRSGIQEAGGGDARRAASPKAAAKAKPIAPAGNGSGDAAGSTASAGDELMMLQARSRQLQNHIGALEEQGLRTDKALAQMKRRVEGAVEMLSAVHEMCDQQKRVIEAQSVATEELTREVAQPLSPGSQVGRPAASQRPPVPQPPAAGGSGEGEDKSDEEDDEVVEQEIAAKTEQMMALLQRADEMQRTLQELEVAQRQAAAAGGRGGGGGDSGAPMPTAAARSGGQDLAAAGEAAGGGRAAAATQNEEAEAEEQLRSLLAEKERYETLLQSSQSEHMDLLSRLTGMRAQMAAMGVEVGSDDGDDDEESEGEGEW